MMDRLSISFVILALLLGTMIGAVSGSLLARVFGLDILNMALFGGPLAVAGKFYLLEHLSVKITPAALLGLLVTAGILYKKGKG